MPYVVKRDDRREPFDENKLRNGFLNSLQKRPVQREDIERSIEHVVHKLQTLGEREVSSRLVGDLVMEELRRLDEVAYVRFASVYRSFQDVTEFQQEIERLQSLPSLLESREQMPLPIEETRKNEPWWDRVAWLTPTITATWPKRCGSRRTVSTIPRRTPRWAA